MIPWLFACASPEPIPVEPGAWTTLDPLPIPAQEVGVLALDGEVWVLGGVDDALVGLDAVQILGMDGTWREGPPLPRPLHHLNAAVHDGTIYVLGGLEGLQFAPTAEAWRLDGQTWTAVTPLPRARGAGAVAVVGDEVVIAGGLPGPSAEVLVYTPATDTWTEGPPLPDRLDHAVGAGGDAVRVFGGRESGITDVRDTTWRLDGQEWTADATLPGPRAGAAGALLPDGAVLIAGGEGDRDTPTGVFAGVFLYEPTTDAWIALPDMPTPRHGTGAAPWQGGVVVPGGAAVQGFGAVDTVEWLTFLRPVPGLRGPQ